MMISVKTFMHQKQTLAKISGPEIMFAETHTRVQEMWGGGGSGGGHMVATCPKISTGTHNS